MSVFVFVFVYVLDRWEWEWKGKRPVLPFKILHLHLSSWCKPALPAAEVIYDFLFTQWLSIFGKHLKTDEKVKKLVSGDKAESSWYECFTLAADCCPIIITADQIVFGGGKLLPRDFACVIITAVANLILKASWGWGGLGEIVNVTFRQKSLQKRAFFRCNSIS